MKRSLLIAVTLLAFVPPSFGQTDDKEIVLPDNVMKQVVSRMVTWYFKPRAKPTTIYFSDSNLKKEWLPEIRGISFVLLNDIEENVRRKGYMIQRADRAGRGYSIGFGYGEVGCPGGGQGDTWYFRVTNSRVRIHRGRGNFGWGCNP
jgi:hypothetical protein